MWWPSPKTRREAERNPYGTRSAVGSQGWANELLSHHVTCRHMLQTTPSNVTDAKSRNATKSLALPAASANLRANSAPQAVSEKCESDCGGINGYHVSTARRPL